MRTRATDCGPADGWRGARIGAETRDRVRRAAHRIPAAIDIGEPNPPRATIAFLLLTVLVTAWEFSTYGTSPGTSDLARAGGAGIGTVATGAWWKLLTANLLHANLLHLVMNAFVLFLMGRWLEHLAGRALVVATIAWSALLASAGALLVDVAHVSIGASGVAFGLVGCAVAIDPRARTATGVIARQLAVVNLIGTFLIPGISIGGHLGGFAAGLLVGFLGWHRHASEQHPAGSPRRLVGWSVAAAAVPLMAVLVVGPSPWPDEAAALRSRIVAPLLSRQLSGTTLDDGSRVEEATCRGTSSPLRYRCEVDGSPAVVTFRTGDDQWSMVTTRG